MRRQLKSFPAKSLNLEIKNNLKNEIQKIANNISEIQPHSCVQESITESAKTGTQLKPEDVTGDEILGDLLFYLRENKLMSTLMICRQIEKIEIEKGVCEISSDTNEVSELMNNEKHKLELDKFFKQKGLGFRIKEKIKQKSKLDLLREFFGDKIILK